jgi:hypothetical protein
MAHQKYFYQDGYSAQEDKKLKSYEEWAGKSLNEVKEGIVNDSLNEEQYGAFSIEFWKDESLVFTCLKAEHDIELIFNHVRKFLWRDKDFVLSVMSERWYYPLTRIEFQDQEFNYFDYIHESLKNDEDVTIALIKLRGLESS